jgi:hypothetical protein
MADFHAVADQVPNVRKVLEAAAAPVHEFKLALDNILTRIHPHETAQTGGPRLKLQKSHPELVRVLKRASDDDAFIARLSSEGSRALRGYHLSLEEQAALVSGDVQWIQNQVGQLDERLSTWLNCRLQQEAW